MKNYHVLPCYILDLWDLLLDSLDYFERKTDTIFEGYLRLNKIYQFIMQMKRINDYYDFGTYTLYVIINKYEGKENEIVNKSQNVLTSAINKLQECLNLDFYKFLKCVDVFNAWSAENRKISLEYLYTWIPFFDNKDKEFAKEYRIYSESHVKLHMEMENEMFWNN